MTGPGQDQQSEAFELYDPKVRHWVWQQHWTELRDAQERAARPIISGTEDVLIAAATASVAAIKRLEMGASLAEVARAFEVNPSVLHRWRREFRQGPGNVFPGLGKRRWEEGQVAQLERKIGQQALEIDFLKGCLQRIDEQRKLQALAGKPLSTSRSRAKRTEARA